MDQNLELDHQYPTSTEATPVGSPELLAGEAETLATYEAAQLLSALGVMVIGLRETTLDQRASEN